MTSKNPQDDGCQSLPVVEFSVGDVKDGSKFKCSMFQSQIKDQKWKRKLICENSHMKYIGSNHDYDPSRQFMKRYIAIVDKKTGKKRFFDADMYKLYPMVHQEDEIDSETERQEAIKKAQSETRSFTERLDSLTDVFGSSVKRKAMAQRQRNKVSDSAEAVKTAIESVISEEGIAAGTMAGEDLNLSILPHNKEAVSDEEVYPLDKFIPSHLRNSVSEAAQELLSPTAQEIQKWKEAKDPRGSRYISWHATHPHPSVQNDQDTHFEYVNCLQILAYIIKVYSPSGMANVKDKYVKGMGEAACQWFLQEFLPDAKTFSLKAKLPARVKDKILAYGVVLSWHIDSCQIDLPMLAEAFSISERKLISVIRALGGISKTIVQGGLKRQVGILKLPLSFPQPHKSKAKR